MLSAVPAALAIKEKALVPEHPDVGHELESCRAISQLGSRVTNAAAMYQEPARYGSQGLGPEHRAVPPTEQPRQLYSAKHSYAERSPHDAACFIDLGEGVIGPSPDMRPLENLATVLQP